MEKLPITYTELQNNVIVGTALKARSIENNPNYTKPEYRMFYERGWKIDEPKVFNSIVDWLKENVQDPHIRGIVIEVSKNWQGKEKLRDMLRGFVEEDNSHIFVFKEK